MIVPSTQTPEPEPVDRDERLGEAIEAYLAQAETGPPPDLDDFVALYPDLGEELREALEGLALVRGLVGRPDGHGARLEAGRRIAGYKIVRELGRGGMGVVYEAVHVDLDRPVALKVLGTQTRPDSSGRRRFLNEAKTAASLHHTHIVPVFDVGQVGGLCYYAMQRIEGSGLDRVLRRIRRERPSATGSSTGSRLSLKPPRTEPAADADLTGTGTGSWGLTGDPAATRPSRRGTLGLAPVDEAVIYDPPRGSAYYRWVCEVGRQAAQALAYAHARGVVHRDIKPSNLLVDARGTAWVADFGLARRLAEDTNLTQTDSRLGTPRYMSPEQADGRPIDARTDIYSLGATLYELLTLRPPFEGRTAAELARQILGRDPVAPRHFDRHLPRDLETIVLKAMSKRSTDRYATAQDLADDLIRFLRHEPVKARRISPVGRAWRLVQRHPTSSLITSAAATVVLAVAAWSYVRILEERDVARQAEKAKEAQRQDAEASRAETQRALSRQLLSEAALLRRTNTPGRRERGLALIRQALERATPDLIRDAREEAMELMAQRDVGDRRELPTGRVAGLAFAPKGNLLTTLSNEGSELMLWDVATGNPARPTIDLRSNPNKDSDPFYRMSPSRIVAAGNRVAAITPDGTNIRFFDAVRGEPLGGLTPTGRYVLAVFASPDGGRFLTIERERFSERQADRPGERSGDRGGFGSKSLLLLWDPERPGEPIATLEDDSEAIATRNGRNGDVGPGQGPGKARNDEPPPLVSFSPDSQTIAIARAGDTVVSLWSAEDGLPVSSPDKNGEEDKPLRIDTKAFLTALALGPSGLLATGGGGGLQLWDTRNLAPLPTLNTHLNRVARLRFSRDGWLAASGFFSAGVELWDPTTGSLVSLLPTPDRVDDLAFSPSGSGRTLAAAAGSRVVTWTIVDPIGVRRFTGFENPVHSLTFGPRDQLAMPSFRTRKPLRVWDPSLCSFNDREWTDVMAELVAFAADGRLLAITNDWEASPRWFRTPDTGSDFVQPTADGTLTFVQHRSPTKTPTLAIASAQDGRVLFLTRGPELYRWDQESPGKAVAIHIPRGYDDPRKWWRGVCVSPSLDRLFLHRDRSVHAYRLSGTTTEPLEWKLPGDIEAMTLSSDGGTLALGTRDGEVVLVDATSGAILGRWAPSTDSDDQKGVVALAFDPTSPVLAVACRQGPVQLWDVSHRNDPTLQVRLPGHFGAVSALAFSKDGRQLATAGEDRTVIVWDLHLACAELEKLGLGW